MGDEEEEKKKKKSLLQVEVFSQTSAGLSRITTARDLAHG